MGAAANGGGFLLGWRECSGARWRRPRLHGTANELNATEQSTLEMVNFTLCEFRFDVKTGRKGNPAFSSPLSSRAHSLTGAPSSRRPRACRDLHLPPAPEARASPEPWEPPQAQRTLARVPGEAGGNWQAATWGGGPGHGPAWTPGPQGHSKMTTVRAWLTQGQGLQGCVSTRSKEPRRTFWAQASRRLGEADADLRLPHGSACVTSSSQPGGHRPPSLAGSEEPGTLRQVGACGAGLLDPHRASCRTPNEAVWVPAPSLMSRKQAKGQRQAREREGRRPR